MRFAKAKHSEAMSLAGRRQGQRGVGEQDANARLSDLVLTVCARDTLRKTSRRIKRKITKPEELCALVGECRAALNSCRRLARRRRARRRRQRQVDRPPVSSGSAMTTTTLRVQCGVRRPGGRRRWRRRHIKLEEPRRRQSSTQSSDYGRSVVGAEDDLDRRGQVGQRRRGLDERERRRRERAPKQP